jgi:hypothetical protein
LLALCHPFIGKKVLQAEDDDGSWDAEPVASDEGGARQHGKSRHTPVVCLSSMTKMTIPIRALAVCPAPWSQHRDCVAFFKRLSAQAREHPHSRPAMAFWALELTKAFDHSLDCLECAMSYFPDDHGNCPYCDGERPAFVRVQTPRWEIVVPASTTEFSLPHRLFYPFSFENHDDREYECVLNFAAKTVLPARGAKAFPESLTFKFVEGGK